MKNSSFYPIIRRLSYNKQGFLNPMFSHLILSSIKMNVIETRAEIGRSCGAKWSHILPPDVKYAKVTHFKIIFSETRTKKWNKINYMIILSKNKQ